MKLSYCFYSIFLQLPSLDRLVLLCEKKSIGILKGKSTVVMNRDVAKQLQRCVKNTLYSTGKSIQPIDKGKRQSIQSKWHASYNSK